MHLLTWFEYSILRESYTQRRRNITEYHVFRLGVVPIADLAGWTDVLHLSSKWNFQDLRAAAMKAIQPLASCVDMIALARTYGITDWVPDAFEKVLARKDDLTVQEARRIPLEDFVAIAKGRLQARSHDLKPQDQVQAVARGILGLAPIKISLVASDVHPSSSSRVSTKPQKAKAAPAELVHDKGSPEEHEMVARWFVQQINPASAHAAEECLTEYTRTRIWSRPLILEHFVMRGLQDFICAYDQDPTSFIRPASTDTTWQYPPTLLSDSSSIRFLRSLAPDNRGWFPNDKLISVTDIREACLKAVDAWKSIGQYSCDDTSHRNSIVVRSRYVDYLVTNGVTTDDVYRDFWQSMTLLFKDQSMSPTNIELARNLVTELGACTCVLKASFEMDSLYNTAESAMNAAQKAGLHELKISLEVCIKLSSAEGEIE
jgi:hypothetical protein